VVPFGSDCRHAIFASHAAGHDPNGFGERAGWEGAEAARPELRGSVILLKDVRHTNQPVRTSRESRWMHIDGIQPPKPFQADGLALEVREVR
jgi:hypothetical protein